MTRNEQIAQLEKDWSTNPGWANVRHGYSAEDVVRLRGSRRTVLRKLRMAL